jgi:predicted PolB exonuclease-like 3'-5' exonuclease
LISIDCFFADAEKYERDARRYWDIFYKRHEDKVAILAPLFVK